MDLGLKNSEGYYDLTAYEAIKNIYEREAYRKKLIYICSPFRGETEKNMKLAQRYCRFVVSKGFTPIAVHLLFPQFMNDEKPIERQIAFKMCFEVLSRCDELWSFGENLSDGMIDEIAKAKELHKLVRYFTAKCEEVGI